MKILRHPAEMHTWRNSLRSGNDSVGLVPTMGSLHAGHISLIEAARKANDQVVMSLFVNPTQFEASADLDSYPRQEQRDIEIAADHGVDLLYAPSPADIYPDGFSTTVAVTGGMTEILEGSTGSRGSSHFAGVTTVVAKLLNAIDPDRAYFGQKDAQQAAVIHRMVADLEFRTEIVVLPTIRDSDGLAFSSRNTRLSPADRERAKVVSAALFEAETVAAERGLSAGIEAGLRHLGQAGIEAEYFEGRDPETLEPVGDGCSGPVLIAVAARIGGVRLIDNIVIQMKQTARSTR